LNGKPVSLDAFWYCVDSVNHSACGSMNPVGDEMRAFCGAMRELSATAQSAAYEQQ
jgi:hypothetical protein